MKKTTILRGTWSKKCNFTGKNLAVEQIHIPIALMTDLGYKPGDDAKGFSVAYKTELIGQLDANSNPVIDPETNQPLRVERVTATAAFATADEMHQAFADDANHDILIKAKVQASAKSVGLTDSAINSLLSVAI